MLMIVLFQSPMLSKFNFRFRASQTRTTVAYHFDTCSRPVRTSSNIRSPLTGRLRWLVQFARLMASASAWFVVWQMLVHHWGRGRVGRELALEVGER
jgi:hypothetical protein